MISEPLMSEVAFTNIGALAMLKDADGHHLQDGVDERQWVEDMHIAFQLLQEIGAHQMVIFHPEGYGQN
jgi:hypothetical protein